MQINGIVETALHVADVDRSSQFYKSLFNLPQIAGSERFAALAVPGNAVLLLFLKDGTPAPMETPGGVIPPHGGSGDLHFAMKVDSIDDCLAELAHYAIPIESTVHWPRGGTSIYFRDPDHHLVELITPGCWEVY
jgi:catechol 2,3-dioxygenase-like lactoylglutathione lyase family enzyme